MRYRTLYADPPWAERGAGKSKRGADRHYDLMSTNDICALPVAEMMEEDAHLYLWVTNNFLPDGLRVMQAWRFRYVTMVTWAKDKVGLGQYYRGQTEHCLFGVRGNLDYRVRNDGSRAQGRTLIMSNRHQHSEKPDEMRRMIEDVSPPPYIELFARKRVLGWDVWGNESEVLMGLWGVR